MKKQVVSVDFQVLSFIDTSKLSNEKCKPFITESSSEQIPGVDCVTQNSSLIDLVSSSSEDFEEESNYDLEVNNQDQDRSFLAFRVNFLFVILVVMLADGLQGKSFRTHRLFYSLSLTANPLIMFSRNSFVRLV
jgi:hypothetical protein